jgi:hypothetical protein
MASNTGVMQINRPHDTTSITTFLLITLLPRIAGLPALVRGQC